MIRVASVSLMLPANHCSATSPKTVRVFVEKGALRVRNTSKDLDIDGGSLSPIMLDILQAGGLTPYLRKHGDFVGIT